MGSRWARLPAILAVSQLSIRLFAQTPAPAAPDQSETAIARVISQQSGLLNSNDSSITMDQREQAAERLLEGHRPDTNAVLLQALQTGGSRTARDAQAAVADAIAKSTQPDAQFVPALLKLLPIDPVSAVDALSSYSSTSQAGQVLTQLIATAKDWRLGTVVRGEAVRGLGSFTQKPAADYLVSLVQNTTEEESLRAKAGDALAHLTGQNFGDDGAKWATWWAANGNVSDAQWQQNMLAAKAASGSNAQRQLQNLQARIKDQFTNIYNLGNDAQQLQYLLAWLRDTSPAIRSVAADLVGIRKANGQRIPDPILQQLWLMVGDSSVDVRTKVIVDLKSIADPGSVPPLLAQLALETDPEVKRQIALTLGQLQQASAVGPLLAVLDDPNWKVAEAAANALATLGPQIRTDTAQRTAVEQKLRTNLQQVEPQQAAQQPGAERLRAALLEALAPLQDTDMLQTFGGALNADNPLNQSPRVRIAAVRGLQNMVDPGAKETAGARLRGVMHQDPDASVRLAAVEAVGDVGTLASQGPGLYERMDPANEQDASVRSAAWTVLLNLCNRPEVTADTLRRSWVDQNLISSDPQKQLAIDKVVRDKLQAGDSSEPNPPDALAAVRTNIGGLCMRLKLWDEAIQNLQPALDYWDSHNAPRATTANVSDQLMQALLNSADYAKAVQFASQRIAKSDQEQQDMGRLIRDEVDSLQKSGSSDDLKHAQDLANQALTQMKPPLNSDYADQIRQYLDQINKKLANPATPGGSDNNAPQGSGQ